MPGQKLIPAACLSDVRNLSTATFRHSRCSRRRRSRCRHQVVATTTAAAAATTSPRYGQRGATTISRPAIDVDNDRNDLIWLQGTTSTTTTIAITTAAIPAGNQHAICGGDSSWGCPAGGRGDGRTVGGGRRGCYAKVIGYDGIVLGGRGRRGR